MLPTSLIFLLSIISPSFEITSPIPTFITYEHTVELATNVSDLWWTVNETSQEIIFELHVKTTGWIALGISPGKKISDRLSIIACLLGGGMVGADIAVGWVNSAAQVYVQVRISISH